MTQEKTQGLKIEFTSPRLIETIPAQQIIQTSLEIIRMIDIPIQKKVVAFCIGIGHEIVLWEGEAYDAIGDWTNEDVSNRINELFPPQE